MSEKEWMVESANAPVPKASPTGIPLPVRDRDGHYCMANLGRDIRAVPRPLGAILEGLSAGHLPWPFYLWGDVGVGKTRAILAFCNGHDWARYWTVESLKDRMLEKRAPWQIDYGVEPALAVLDELGAHLAKDFEYDAVKAFLDWREDKPAVYVSNQPAGALLELYDKRIVSRLCAGTVFHLKGLDRRARGVSA